MDSERSLAGFRRLLSLAQEFRDKRYRDGYVAAHARSVLSRQMRNFRGKLSQMEFAEKLGKQKTVVARLENPAYGGWSIRTMLEIARKLDVAVFVRFVDFPTFLQYTGDLSGGAVHPASYDEEAIDELAREAERTVRDRLLKEIFDPNQWGVEKGASTLVIPPPLQSPPVTVTEKAA